MGIEKLKDLKNLRSWTNKDVVEQKILHKKYGVRCKICDEIKPWGTYHKEISNRIGISSTCNPCAWRISRQGRNVAGKLKPITRIPRRLVPPRDSSVRVYDRGLDMEFTRVSTGGIDILTNELVCYFGGMNKVGSVKWKCWQKTDGGWHGRKKM